MNKTAIKNFAVEARKMLIKSAISEAGLYGITKDVCEKPIQTGNGFEVYKTLAGTDNRIFGDTIKKRASLVKTIDEKGFDNVIEEVAYTWFNRLIAIRFMEVNDYLPTRARVLSSETSDKKEPDIVTQALDVDLNMSEEELAEVQKAKDENRYDDAFVILFIKQCNELNKILPGLFETTDDYMELLLKLSYTNDGVLRMLVDTISEEDFDVSKEGQIEIIGWLYQYYNTEMNERIYDGNMSKSKVNKELLPAATQLFTPDWPIKYMVENTLGKLYPTKAQKNWEYYIETYYNDSKKNLEDIKVIDPCMGSGHILVRFFDVLFDLYTASGYTNRDAAVKIIENNIFGIDIDKRAYQLSYFAIMMKGRFYNRRIFSEVKKTGLVYVEESNDIQLKHLPYYGRLDDQKHSAKESSLRKIMEALKDTKEIGSAIIIKDYYDVCELEKYVSEINTSQMNLEMIGIENTQAKLKQILKFISVIQNKYDAVVTNPPYLGISRFSSYLSDYVNQHYNDVKTDLSMVMYKKSLVDLVRDNGFVAFITTSSWLNLKSFQNIRELVIDNYEIDTLVDFGTELFEGKVGHNPIVAWCVKKKEPEKQMLGIRLVNFCYAQREEKKTEFFNKNNWYYTNQEQFKVINGSPIMYSASEKLLRVFNHKALGEIASPRQGLATGKNDLFIRMWYEVDKRKINFHASSVKDSIESKQKWFPYNKGGSYRKWYGNNDFIINWYNDGSEIRKFKGSVIRNPNYYFKKCITWSKISSGRISFRYKQEGNIFDVAGTSVFINDERKLYYLLGYCNSNVAMQIATMMSPTMNYEVGHIASFPVKFDESIIDKVVELVKKCIAISKEDWDDKEVSWNFKVHPLVKLADKTKTLSEVYEEWKCIIDNRRKLLKSYEEEINKLFSKSYELDQEISNVVGEKYISINSADYKKNIRSLLSYFVGCILGRFSINTKDVIMLNEIGQHISSGEMIDVDNIVPITNEEYFEDDIVGLIVRYVKLIFGNENYEKNMNFISDALGKGNKNSKEALRDYFINDFWSEHCALYTTSAAGKRPIYWLFDAGKQDAFKCLIYIQRYDEDTVGRIRTDYLHKTQSAIESVLKNAEYIISSSNSATDKAKATKDRDKYIKQLAEIRLYDQALAYIAHQRIEIDLDDGVKHNYQLFQGVEISSEGTKEQKIDLLAKI